MLDCLLVFPPISIDERYAHGVGDVGGHMPPLGLATLAAVLKEEGFSAGILDAPVLGLSMEGVLEKIAELRPMVVGFSSLTPTFNRTLFLAEKLRERFPEIVLVVGGHHATILPEEVMKKGVFDVLVYGEGEKTFTELLSELKRDKKIIEKKEKLKKIDGIYFLSGEKIVKTKPRELIEDLDKLPFPARELLPMEKYLPLPNQYKRKPVANMVLIRGCPYNCTYCSSHSMFGRKIRARSPFKAVEEMKRIIKEFGIKEISFWDDTLTANKKWLHELCDLMIKEKLDLTWSCYGRVNTVDKGLLDKMKEAGCWNIFYGIESGSQKLLDIINKRTNPEQIRKAVKLTKEAGIEARGSFMLALPGETPELAEKTIDFAVELDVDYAQFCITTPFPGTQLYEDAKKYGKLIEDFDKYSIWEPVFIPHGYKSIEEIKELQKKAFRKFYLRPNYVLKRILKIRGWTDIKRNIQGLKMIRAFS